jgi:hypothetical protein
MESKKFIDRQQKKLIGLSTKSNKEESEGDEIDKLVSLTFDENPTIRAEVAKKLSNFLSDPRAVLALIDLSSDKNENVKIIAKSALENYTNLDKEAFSSLEKFFEKIHNQQNQEEISKEWEKEKSILLPQIEKLFSSEDAKRKLLPSIERIIKKSKKPSQVIEQIKPIDSYLASEVDELKEDEKTQKHQEPIFSKEEQLQKSEQTNFPLPKEVEQKINSPVFSIPKIEQLDDLEAIEEKNEEKLPNNFLDVYKFAYILATTPGIKAADLNKEKKRLLTETKKAINLAFKLASKKAKEEGRIENLSGLKVGMKKISTYPLEVLDITTVLIQKQKKPTQFIRVLLSDGKNSIPLYLSLERGEGIKKGDYLALKDAVVDFIIKNPLATVDGEKGELCFVLSKKSQIILTR